MAAAAQKQVAGTALLDHEGEDLLLQVLTKDGPGGSCPKEMGVSINIWLMMLNIWFIYGQYIVNIWLIYG